LEGQTISVIANLDISILFPLGLAISEGFGNQPPKALKVFLIEFYGMPDFRLKNSAVHSTRF